jgi:hypothetical protein
MLCTARHPRNVSLVTNSLQRVSRNIEVTVPARYNHLKCEMHRVLQTTSLQPADEDVIGTSRSGLLRPAHAARSQFCLTSACRASTATLHKVRRHGLAGSAQDLLLLAACPCCPVLPCPLCLPHPHLYRYPLCRIMHALWRCGPQPGTQRPFLHTTCLHISRPSCTSLRAHLPIIKPHGKHWLISLRALCSSV